MLSNNIQSSQAENVQLLASPDVQPFVLFFQEISAQMLPVVGGKAANLGELTRAGLPVPSGFCVTTEAYMQASKQADLEDVLDQLSALKADDLAQQEKYSEVARNKLLSISMPVDIVEAVTRAYTFLTSGEPIPMAVRSSATAEDLPFASFAGQQDTYLNILGLEEVLDAIRRCWASLWTNRAVSYRASNAIDQRGVRLAVVVQKMVDVEVAGVLFTANPLNGRRSQAVIDASPGLGEAVVSGAVNPDHFVVNLASGEILERRSGDKRVSIRPLPGGGTQRIERDDQQNTFCLTDEQIKHLTSLGGRVEAFYGTPQDTEWALDTSGQFWLTQARPITTLYPLPDDAPPSEQDLRIYFSVNVAQGVYRPFTPMGIAGFRLAASSFATFLKLPPKDVLAGPPIAKEAGLRLFADLTTPLRHSLGRKIILRILSVMEARSGQIFQQLTNDPRLTIVSKRRGPIIRTLLGILFSTGVAFRVTQALISPSAARKRMWQIQSRLEAQSKLPADILSDKRLDTVEALFIKNIGPVLLGNMPAIMIPGLLLHFLAGKLLGDATSPDELQTILRSLPYNVTTEMDLALWDLAQQIRQDSTAASMMLETAPAELARLYALNSLPSCVQQGLANFLHTYGHRGVAEIDMGLPRWSEDPTHILGVLTNYLRLERPELAPDVQFQRGEREAQAMLEELTKRARKQGWLRGKLVHYCLSQVRALGGLRELPKYYLVLIMASARQILWPVGEELVQAGRLENAEDIFFISLAEAHQALSGQDFHTSVHERRAMYEHEVGRRHVPRILLSDGTEPEVTYNSTKNSAVGGLSGSPASAGVVTGVARVILNPIGAHLEPGEILVAPSTDPGWTPLFLTAGGLVMEMGGSMSHGAVVAREYGIPAVVGVHGATEQIFTGQRITVRGSEGIVLIEPEEKEG